MTATGAVFRIPSLFMAAIWVLSLSLASFLKLFWRAYNCCSLYLPFPLLTLPFNLTLYLTVLLSLVYLLVFSGDGLFKRMSLDFLLSVQTFLTSSGRPLTCFVLLIPTTSSLILLVVSLNFVKFDDLCVIIPGKRCSISQGEKNNC